MEFPKLQVPFTFISAGGSGTGKSFFVRQLIEHRQEMFSIVPDKIVWFYGIYQPMYDEIKDVTFVEGLPSDYKKYLGTQSLYVIDDLMMEATQSSNYLTKLFTRESHHLNISVIFITQNFFFKGREMREITLNAHYIHLCKNRRDLSQIMHLGRQLFPRHMKFFQEVYEDATLKPYSYLFIDMKSATPEELRLRTNILPNEIQYIYQRKHS